MLIIDENKYVLDSNNYINVETLKKYIVIGNTFNDGMKHFYGWKNRYNGNYKKTAHYTISKNGTVYKHFDPKYYSEYLTNTELNEKSIVILIENHGWLYKDLQKNQYITISGNIYSDNDDVLEKRWRGYNYWANYNEKQIESAIELVKQLCKDYSIPLISVDHNTKIDNISMCEGVIYKSNIEKYYTDLTPSWDFIGFKESLEIK